ncbi:MAG: glycoside hydrolase family 3 N-terminal domain-containing protein [Candidatus Latescibacterota bacterium]|jgi:beta-N-acetylhexosaminidase
MNVGFFWLLLLFAAFDPGTRHSAALRSTGASPEQARGTSHVAPGTFSDSLGQMILVGFRGKSVDRTTSIYRDIVDRNIGGVILFDYDVPLRKTDRNIESPEQVEALTSTLQSWAETPLLIAIDQEGGRVNRLKQRYGFPKSVSAGYLGSLDNPDSTRFYADQTASILSGIGVNLNFAPVVDLNVNPENPIIGKIERSFSADAGTVVEHAAIVIRSHDEQGVVTALKHFPGHGSSTGDTHLGLVDVTDTWQRSELDPYRMLVDSGLVRSVMTAHVINRQLDPSGISSTLSRPIVTGVLRSEIGFEGVVFSDDLQMGAIRDQYDLETVIREALNAGVDILTFANNSVYEPDIAERAIAIIQDLVDRGEVTEQRIRESYRRIQLLKSRLET